MSNFQNAFNEMMRLIDTGMTVSNAQDQVTLKYGLDDVDGEGLIEEYYTAIGDTDEGDDFDDDFMTDAEADADVLRSAGYGTDEDYGFFGGDEW